MKVFSAMEFLACAAGIVTWYWSNNSESGYENLDNPELRKKLVQTAQTILEISRLLARFVSLGVLTAFAVLLFGGSCATDSPKFYNQAGTMVKWEYGLHLLVQLLYVIVIVISLMFKVTRKLIKRRRTRKEEALKALNNNVVEEATDIELQNKDDKK
jgi:uncharacterized membrane protein